MKDAKFVTTIDGQVNVTTRIFAQENGSADFTLKFAENSILHTEKIDLIAGENEFKLSIHITDPILWSPDTPYLYEGELQLSGSFGTDTVSTYFGVRENPNCAF